MASATDRRRITGPESSYPPPLDQVSEENTHSINGRRGRQPGDIRPICAGIPFFASDQSRLTCFPSSKDRSRVSSEWLIVHRDRTSQDSLCSASAIVEITGTRLLSSAMQLWPSPSEQELGVQRQWKIECRSQIRTFLLSSTTNTEQSQFLSGPEFGLLISSTNKDSEDRDVSRLVQQSLEPAIRLELFPKSVIDVFVTVLETDGLEASVAAAATAAGTALAHAGIELFGLVASCSAALVAGEIWLDPTTAEREMADGVVVVSGLPALASVTNIWQTGRLSPTEMTRVS